MKKIGIFFICTGRYRIFWDSFFQSAERYLFTDSAEYEKNYFVLTDHEIPPHRRVYTSRISKEPWPSATLKRWHYFLQAEEDYSWVKEMDYVYFFNANLIFTGNIDTELLPQQDNPLVLLQHPSFGPQEKEFPYERNPESLAYIPVGQGESYFMGSLLGGESSAFYDLCIELRKRTDTDKIIPIWHDESHLNRYAVDYPERITVLPYTKTTIEEKDGSLRNNIENSSQSILILEKSRPQWGGHAWLRGQSSNRITVKVTGGLGNQLWQYAAGLALQAKHEAEGNPVELYLDTTFFGKEKKRKFLLSQLVDNIHISKANLEYPVYIEPQQFIFYPEFFELPPAITLKGFFQHYRYFELARPHLNLCLISMPEKYSELKYELVALHVRRGDYLEPEWLLRIGLAPLDYYRAALREIQKQVQNPYILIFSDDISWVKKHLVPELHLPHSFPYDVTKGKALEDFSIMAQCQHFIIANSSYSAFAAMLGAKSGSVVFMPPIWHLAHNACSEQLLPHGWQVPTYKLFKGPVLKSPAISLIIPVYNTEAYLARCLESVCSQTEQNIEIIIVDDASTDNSWAIIQDYTARDSRIRAIRHSQNKKQGAARNTGIEAARAEWLLFLDSDDYLCLNTVEILLSASKEYPELELIIFGGFRVLPNGQLQEHRRAFPNARLLSDVFKEYCMGKGSYIGHEACFKLWKRSLFGKIPFPEYMTVEDFAVIPRVFIQLQGDKTLVLPKRLYMYQYRKGSLNNHFTEQSAKDFGQTFHILQEFAAQLEPERHHLLESRMLQEFEDILEQTQHSEFTITLIEHLPKDLLAKGLWELSSKFHQIRKDHWYRLGLLPHKRKLWVIAKVFSKRFKIYSLLQPMVKRIKPILRKR